MLNNFIKFKLKNLINNKNIFVLPYFIPEVKQILKEIERENFILFAGRIEYYKGLKNLIYALKLVNKKMDVHLIVAGDGREKKEMEDLARKINAKVRFLGKVNHKDMLELYQRAGIVCVPSRADNSPVVIYEAMMYGTPVVASNVGGIPDLVDDGVTGFLFNANDSMEMAEKITRILENSKLREQMSENARIKAKKEFSKDKHIKEILNIYRHSIEEYKNKKVCFIEALGKRGNSLQDVR